MKTPFGESTGSRTSVDHLPPESPESRELRMSAHAQFIAALRNIGANPAFIASVKDRGPL